MAQIISQRAFHGPLTLGVAKASFGSPATHHSMPGADQKKGKNGSSASIAHHAPSCSLLPGADFVLNPVIFFYFLLFFVKQKRFCFHTEPLAGTTGSPRHSETSCFLPLRRLRLLPAPSLAPFPRTCSAQTSVRILSSFISFCFLLFLVLKKNNSRFCESY